MFQKIGFFWAILEESLSFFWLIFYFLYWDLNLNSSPIDGCYGIISANADAGVSIRIGVNSFTKPCGVLQQV